MAEKSLKVRGVDFEAVVLGNDEGPKEITGIAGGFPLHIHSPERPDDGFTLTGFLLGQPFQIEVDRT